MYEEKPLTAVEICICLSLMGILISSVGIVIVATIGLIQYVLSWF